MQLMSITLSVIRIVCGHKNGPLTKEIPILNSENGPLKFQF